MTRPLYLGLSENLRKVSRAVHHSAVRGRSCSEFAVSKPFRINADLQLKEQACLLVSAPVMPHIYMCVRCSQCRSCGRVPGRKLPYRCRYTWLAVLVHPGRRSTCCSTSTAKTVSAPAHHPRTPTLFPEQDSGGGVHTVDANTRDTEANFGFPARSWVRCSQGSCWFGSRLLCRVSTTLSCPPIGPSPPPPSPPHRYA